MAFVAVLFAVAWQTVKADPFIPVGNDPGGAGDEKTLYGRSTGFAWRAASLLYFYVSVPTPGAVNNETLYKAVFFPPVDKFSKLTIPGSTLGPLSSPFTLPITFSTFLTFERHFRAHSCP
jgi:hypothetical protein